MRVCAAAGSGMQEASREFMLEAQPHSPPAGTRAVPVTVPQVRW
jgi:hypothetical protein